MLVGGHQRDCVLHFDWLQVRIAGQCPPHKLDARPITAPQSLKYQSRSRNRSQLYRSGLARSANQDRGE